MSKSFFMKKKNLIMFFFLRKMSPCGSSILQEEIKGMFRTFRRRKGEVFDIEPRTFHKQVWAREQRYFKRFLGWILSTRWHLCLLPAIFLKKFGNSMKGHDCISWVFFVKLLNYFFASFYLHFKKLIKRRFFNFSFQYGRVNELKHINQWLINCLRRLFLFVI